MKNLQSSFKEVFPLAFLFGLIGFISVSFLLSVSNKGPLIFIPCVSIMVGSMLGFIFLKRNFEMNYLKSFLIGVIVFVTMNISVFINAIISNRKYDALHPETNYFLIYCIRFLIIVAVAVISSSILALFFMKRNKVREF